MNALESLRHFLPESFLLGTAFLVLILDWLTPQKKALGILALLGLAGYFLLTQTRLPHETLSLFEGFFIVDRITRFSGYLIALITAITLLLSFSYRELPKRYEGEYYALFLFMAFALALMAASTNLLALFLSIEFVSLLSYLMTGLLKKDVKSKEAAIKYFLFGSTASAVMLYGMSILYGLTGSLDLMIMAGKIADPNFRSLVILSLVFILTGLGFKISMAPFHLWAPDVYEAAPTPVTAFLTVAPKALGFIVLVRVLGSAFEPMAADWQSILTGLSILTMTVGNIAALSQTNIKRLIAYSSIAQAGYILMGLAVFGNFGTTSIWIYLAAYAFTNLGVFAVVIAVSNQTGSDDLAAYQGLARRSPGLAATLTLFLISLAGIPPLAGFIAKFFVFAAVIRGHASVLAIAAALNSAIAAYYYFRIVKAAYLCEPLDPRPIPLPFSLGLGLLLCLAGVLLLGLAPQSLITFAQSCI